MWFLLVPFRVFASFLCDGFLTVGERQNFALCRKAECIIGFGVLIEAVFPELVQASAAGDATQRQNILRAAFGPKHAGLFAACANDRLASGFHAIADVWATI
jgi:hypothetical protein